MCGKKLGVETGNEAKKVNVAACEGKSVWNSVVNRSTCKMHVHITGEVFFITHSESYTLFILVWQ